MLSEDGLYTKLIDFGTVELSFHKVIRIKYLYHAITTREEIEENSTS